MTRTLTLVKNPFWPGSDEIPQAKIEEVVFSMLDQEPAFADYEAGNLDMRDCAAKPDRPRQGRSDAVRRSLSIAPGTLHLLLRLQHQGPVRGRCRACAARCRWRSTARA